MKKTLIVLLASCTLLSCESMQEKSDYFYRIAINLIINTRMYLLPMYTFLMISGRHVSKPFVV